MSGSRRSYDTDQLIIRHVTALNPNDSPINANTVLTADGAGGTYWAVPCTLGALPAYTNVLANGVPMIANKSTNTLTLTTIGGGINMDVNSTTKTISFYSGSFQEFDISGGNTLLAYSNSIATPTVTFTGTNGIRISSDPLTNTIRFQGQPTAISTGIYAYNQINVISNASTLTNDAINNQNNQVLTATSPSTMLKVIGVGDILLTTNTTSNAYFIGISSFTSKGWADLSGVAHSTFSQVLSTVSSLYYDNSEVGIATSSIMNSLSNVSTGIRQRFLYDEWIVQNNYTPISLFNLFSNSVIGAQYVSTPSLVSTVAGLGTSETGMIVSTVAGLGSSSYISTPSLISSVAGLGTMYISSFFGQVTSPLLGNILLVDSVNGNDSTATPGGLPYKTVSAAVSAATSGKTIWILPGTYTLSAGLVLPSGIALRGANIQTTILTWSPSTSGIKTLLTMGSNTRVEDLTLTLTTSTPGVNLIGVYFPTTTTTSSKLRTLVINVSSTSGDSTFAYGIYGDGTSTNPKSFQTSSAIRACTVNCTGNVTGAIRSCYFTGALQFSARDTIFYANGSGSAANVIGVESTNSGSFIILKTSSVSGSTYDIRQPSGLSPSTYVIQLNATDLINGTAASNGFTVNTDPNHLLFTSVGNWGASTHYMTPGTIAYNQLSATPIGIPFIQRIIVFGALITCQPPLLNSDSVTVTLYKSSSPSVLGTSFATLTANTTNGSSVRIENVSSTFNPVTDYLQVQITTTNLTNSGTTIMVYLPVY